MAVFVAAAGGSRVRRIFDPGMGSAKQPSILRWRSVKCCGRGMHVRSDYRRCGCISPNNRRVVVCGLWRCGRLLCCLGRPAVDMPVEKFTRLLHADGPATSTTGTTAFREEEPTPTACGPTCSI